MDSTKLILSLTCLFLISLLSGKQVDGSAVNHHQHHHHHRSHRHLFNFRPSKLFVFGDSYVDTGNNRKSLANSWKYPYGITFPGKPAGRFSDGRVLTDYLAKFMGVKSPIPYKWRKFVGLKQLKYGMNFAYGGTGVFNTWIADPNMTAQIDLFQQLISDSSVYTTFDIHSSASLVSFNGNDYAYYLARNGSSQGMRQFITSVVSQLALNLKRIHSFGAKKIAVTALGPLGCLPQTTVTSSFQQCNETQNSLVDFHNLLLQQAVANLNNETRDSTFVILDLHGSFLSVLKNKGDHLGSAKFENPLKPCCVGISSEYSCGSIDVQTGAKKYTVCEDPGSAFFWDNLHPTQEGWRALYSALQATLQQIF